MEYDSPFVYIQRIWTQSRFIERGHRAHKIVYTYDPYQVFLWADWEEESLDHRRLLEHLDQMQLEWDILERLQLAQSDQVGSRKLLGQILERLELTQGFQVGPWNLLEESASEEVGWSS
ncbi:hypothetical protein M9H77_13375 [Catharanthus roseus]|uniref:Uncharacterized protein n=1 Tax=Catharanthus roseus TaxID=4058 RepID=A0ACC0BKA6_CATRO|nr:hypothetical protein M9H77_13375 [Catharanthus roseus]